MMMSPSNAALVKSTQESQHMNIASACRTACHDVIGPSSGCRRLERNSRSSARLSLETLSVVAALASSPQESPATVACAARNASGSILKRHSSTPVRRQLSFGKNETLEFDNTLPSFYCTVERVSANRWRPSGLDRSISLPRIPSRDLD